MAQSSFPFEGIDTTETQYSQLFRTFQGGVNGTYNGTELKVTAGTGLAVNVALGQAMVRGHFYVSTATESLSLTTADGSNPRLDLVVLRLDPVANSIVLAVKDGTPAGSPTAPALVQTDAGTFEIALATVLVPASAGAPSTITDKREFMGTRVSLWSTDTRPTSVFPHIGFNTTLSLFEGYDPTTTTWSALGAAGGKVLQVVSTSKTDTFSTSSASYVDVTGLSASITPSATSSKVLVIVSANVSNAAGSSVIGQLVRDGSAIHVGDASGKANQQQASFMSYENNGTQTDTKIISFLDSPSSTSALTYGLQINRGNGGTAYINRSSGDEAQVYSARTASSITVMEVGE